MPNVGSICKIINDALLANSFEPRNFQTGNFNLIAEPIQTETEAGNVTTPNIIDSSGEATELVFDDRYPFRLFHLKDGWEYKQAPDGENYGAAGQVMEEDANMMLVFVGSRSQMKVTLDNVLAAVVMDIPKELNYATVQGLSISSCVIEIGSVTTNPYDVWAKIWTNMPYEFSTDTIAFIINYKITTTYWKGCFNLCSTENSPYYY